jgi:hypothetical protein
MYFDSFVILEIDYYYGSVLQHLISQHSEGQLKIKHNFRIEVSLSHQEVNNLNFYLIKFSSLLQEIPHVKSYLLYKSIPIIFKFENFHYFTHDSISFYFIHDYKQSVKPVTLPIKHYKAFLKVK